MMVITVDGYSMKWCAEGGKKITVSYSLIDEGRKASELIYSVFWYEVSTAQSSVLLPVHA